jgi:hypothetical protein
VHIGEPSLFRFCVLHKINACLIPLLFKPFVKFDIAYLPPLLATSVSFHIAPLTQIGIQRPFLEGSID